MTLLKIKDKESFLIAAGEQEINLKGAAVDFQQQWKTEDSGMMSPRC